MAELTPMKRQYNDLKAQHPDCLLFFRLGDFYEMFDEDAKTAAEELNLTLTTRDRNKPEDQRTPMCGVPYHSAEGYIARLIAKGYKVAICEQTEDPAQAKGLVEREVIRVVTPGTLMEENLLEEGKNNFLAALWAGEEGAGLCFGDVSTGEVFLTSFPVEGWQEHAVNELARFSPGRPSWPPAPGTLPFWPSSRESPAAGWSRPRRPVSTWRPPSPWQVISSRPVWRSFPPMPPLPCGRLGGSWPTSMRPRRPTSPT